MSSPVRSEDGFDDPLSYAPRWARRSPSAGMQSPTSADASPMAAGIANSPAPAPVRAGGSREAPRITVAPSTPVGVADSPPMAPGIGGPNIELPPRLRPFQGDLAIKDLRKRLARDPDVIPEPPIRVREGSIIPWIGRFSLVFVVAATVAFAVTLMTLPRQVRQDGLAGMVKPALDEFSRASAQPGRLVVETQRGFANEPIPLGVWLNDGAGNEMVTMVGLARGTKLTAGTPLGLTGWQLSARDLGKAFAWAPRDFVGAMDAAIDLRSPGDRLMDSQFVRLEWLPKKGARLAPHLDPPKPAPVDAPVPQPLDPEGVATLIRRGEDFLRNGDIAAARIALRRGANAGNAQAALMMGATFDPVYLNEQGILGFAPDVAQARHWYEQAAKLGSTEAQRRLQRLAQDRSTQ